MAHPRPICGRFLDNIIEIRIDFIQNLNDMPNSHLAKQNIFSSNKRLKKETFFNIRNMFNYVSRSQHQTRIRQIVITRAYEFSKFNNFLWVCWFLGKNLSNFIPPAWKLHNPYCHTRAATCKIRAILAACPAHHIYEDNDHGTNEAMTKYIHFKKHAHMPYKKLS